MREKVMTCYNAMDERKYLESAEFISALGPKKILRDVLKIPFTCVDKTGMIVKLRAVEYGVVMAFEDYDVYFIRTDMSRGQLVLSETEESKCRPNNLVVKSKLREIFSNKKGLETN